MLSINNNTVSAFLVDSRFKIHRHIVLFIAISIMTLNFVWYIPEKYATSLDKFIGWAIYTIIFLGVIYANLYVLIPRLLLKNKLFIYLILILVFITLTILSILSVQEYMFKMDNNNSDEHILTADIINLVSSFVAFMLFFMGTTAFKLFKNWIIYNQHIEDLESSTLNSELKLLKSQINPHFLFNMLNNANIMVNEDPEIASQILAKLDDLLQYQINDSTKEKVRLNDDIVFLTDFLDLEKTRRDYFDYSISKDGITNDIQVPPLLFIPFVENAVKHNSDSDNLSYINIKFKVENSRLFFFCKNSKPQKPTERDSGGLGLANIKRRLDLLYGNNYSLEIENEETTYTVNLELKL